jgi:Zn-dependent peptidase ImmA (M78 family)
LQFRNAESSTGTQVEEREANQFAAALLMPEEWVCREFEKQPFDLGDDEALSAMCKRFGVSSQAMSFRLVNLGLLKEAYA